MSWNHNSIYNKPIVQSDLEAVWHRVAIDSFQGKSMLITGANGLMAMYMLFAFAYAVEHLGLHVRIVATSRNLSGLKSRYALFLDKSWFEIAEWDVAEPLSRNHDVDYIFHFAGDSSPYHIATDPVGILKANLLGTVNVCEFAVKNNADKIVFASTREVYGAHAKREMLDETSFGVIDPLNPRSCYPESKRVAESVMEAYHLQHGLDYAVARIAHCYGPGMRLENDGRIMADVIAGALNYGLIILRSDGRALRSFCYVTDAIVALLIIAADNTGIRAFNLANETEEIAISDLARLVADLHGECEVTIENTDIDKGLYCAYQRVPLDCSRLEGLGWHPEVCLTDGLKRVIESFRV